MVGTSRHAARDTPGDGVTFLEPDVTSDASVADVVPSSNSTELARRLPDARLELYPDAGHGGIFQHHNAFVPAALKFPGS